MTQEELQTLSQRILTGAQEVVAQAIETHRRMGRSIVIMQGGKIVEIKPRDIPPRPLPGDEE